MFTAAALKDYPISKTFLDAVHSKAGTNSTPGAFPMRYKSDTGAKEDSAARRVFPLEYSSKIA